MKIKPKKAVTFTVKDLEDKGTYSFDDDEIRYIGTRLNIDTQSIEYFIEVDNFASPLVISKEEFEQLQNYIKVPKMLYSEN